MFTEIFGNVFITSGGKGIDGKGYWYDNFLNLIPGYNFEGSTFIAKTVTIKAREGNLPLKANLQPKSFFPKCIKVYPREGAMMNAVGISNPGLEAVLDMNIWQKREEPFLISIMPLGDTLQERLQETRQAVSLLKKHTFSAVIGIQLNVSCPNVGIPTEEYFDEIIGHLRCLKELNWFLDLKLNILYPPEEINCLKDYCDIITCSNSIPFYSIPGIDWDKYSGLEYLGGGGLSGRPLLIFVAEWIRNARSCSKIDIKACGGIMCSEAVEVMAEAGACAIELGTVKLLRPWRVKSIINKCKEIW